MENQFIVPITPIRLWGEADRSGVESVSGGKGAAVFRDVLESFVADAVEAEKSYEQQKYLLATGQIEDAHTVTIAGAYAQMTVDMVVSLRNKALESYNELMRLNI